MEEQSKLFSQWISKEEARKTAYQMIKESFGNIPSIGAMNYDSSSNSWLIQINAKYPRITFDKIQERPKKVRFMNFENLGMIKIDANTGVITEKPRYYDLRGEIIKKIDLIHTTVQKALVKTGANKFSKLPLSEHMHTPIEDIVSILLIKDKIDLTRDFSGISSEDFEKYLKNIEMLTRVGLVRRNENLIIPDNALIEIEQSVEEVAIKLSKALAYFFFVGYEYIESIKQVLGPHLTISGYIYEKSLEYGEITEVGYGEIIENIQFAHTQPLKMVKLPRYLIQLSEVGLIDTTVLKGENFWTPREDIFTDVIRQESILAPVNQLFIGETTS
jgi:hypothetical protein